MNKTSADAFHEYVYAFFQKFETEVKSVCIKSLHNIINRSDVTLAHHPDDADNEIYQAIHKVILYIESTSDGKAAR